MSRPTLHVAAGFLALVLRFLPPVGAIAFALLLVVHNALVLPRYAPSLMRPAGPRADVGVVTYPIVALGLVLLFRDRLHLAAAAWAILAFGDGAAAICGRALGGAPVPWNPEKRLSGSAAFVLAGLPAAVMIGMFVARGSATSAWPDVASALPVLAVATLLAALAESLPWRVDDNVRIGIACAAVFFVADAIDPARLRVALEAAEHRWRLALAVDVAAGLLAWRLKAVDVSGLIAGVALGTVLWSFAGPAAFPTFAVFVALGAVSTRLGRARKEARGLAQARGGRRGVAHAMANAGLAVGLGTLGALSVPGDWLRIGMVAALATAAFDTTATEIGQAFADSAYSPRDGRRVEPGTLGAVSLAGTLGGFAAALVVTLVAVGTGVLSGRAAGAILPAAALGAFAESVVASSPALGGLLDHHGRNLLNTSVGAGASVLLAWVLGT